MNDRRKSVRIVSNGLPGGTEVFSEDGDKIERITGLTLRVGVYPEIPEVDLTIICPKVDVVAEVRDEMHVCPYCGGPVQSEGIDAFHIQRQKEWSSTTFGPGRRTAGVIAHIRKELDEIAADPTDIGEWVDVIVLALDGAWRAGGQPQEIIDAIVAKQARNEARTWPDWRTMTEDDPIEHDRTVGP